MQQDCKALQQYFETLPHHNILHDFCMKEMQPEQQEEILKHTPLLNQTLIYYDQVKESFQLTQVQMIPNIIIMNNTYLVLSTCSLAKLVITQKDQSMSGVHLYNNKGNLFIFFRLKQQFYEWMIKMKSYCKLSKFNEKFRLLEQIMKDFFIIQHKKSKKVYTCQIYKQSVEIDYLHNEIQTLRSIKHQSLLDLKFVYEDLKSIYLVYEYFKGEKLQDLLNQGLVLDQTQLASIVLQILQLMKYLNKNQIYHGNITPGTVIVNTESNVLHIYLVNFLNVVNILAYNQQTTLDFYLSQVYGAFIAPEILLQKQLPNISTDLYQLGALLYYLTFYTYKKRSEMAQLEYINYKMIEDSVNNFDQISLKGSTKFKYKHIFSVSQLDLMKRLLAKSDSRLHIQEAMKHQWFINIKEKMKPKVERKGKVPLPSLRTIIELCEASEIDIKLRKRNSEDFGMYDSNYKVLDEDNKIGALMQEINQRTDVMRLPSKENHEKCKFYGQLKSTVDGSQKSIIKDFQCSNTIS